jgi:hypothetical protein
MTKLNRFIKIRILENQCQDTAYTIADDYAGLQTKSTCAR